MADYTRETVSQNGYSDVIAVIQSRVEDAQIPDQVDFIVSEWMGTLLLVGVVCCYGDGIIVLHSLR